MIDEEALVDAYFRDALFALTGVEPPAAFKRHPIGLKADVQQEWACIHIKPFWACGISLIEAAERMVEDARGNANILNEKATYPAPFEDAMRHPKRKKKAK